MYKIRKVHFLIIIFTTFIFCGSCRKFVQIDTPSTQLATVSVFDNDAAAHAALTTIYAQMQPGGSGESFYMAFRTGLLGDELYNINTIPLYQDALLPTYLASQYGPWTNGYNYIFQANAIIEGLSNVKGTTPAIAAQLTGEAKFIRAFWYFYLANCYGDVPIVTSTNYQINAKLSRSPRIHVYEQIISDLNDAHTLLNINYVDATDTLTSTDRVRPVKATAEAFLARAYLYTHQYDSAKTAASVVIADNRFSLVTNLNDVFVANSSEAIWQIAIPQPDNGYQTGDGSNFVLINAPSSGSDLITNWLLESFEPGDTRKTNWIDSVTDGTTVWYFPYKYQINNNSNNPNGRLEYTMMLRLAEQYLIRAEAEAQLGDSTSAINDLNVIRHRAGLSDYAPSSNGPLLTAILHERQVELFCEWGHRWFDLIRTGNINSVMGSPLNICQQKGGIWNPDGHQALYPIPISEINNDHNLSQNPGY